MILFAINYALVQVLCWLLLFCSPTKQRIARNIVAIILLCIVYGVAANRGDLGSDTSTYRDFYNSCAGFAGDNCSEYSRFEPGFRAVFELSKAVGLSFDDFQLLAVTISVVACYCFFLLFPVAFPFFIVMEYGFFYLQLDCSTLRQSIAFYIFVAVYCFARRSFWPAAISSLFHYSAIIAVVLQRQMGLMVAASAIVGGAYIFGPDTVARYGVDYEVYLLRDDYLGIATQLVFLLSILYFVHLRLTTPELIMCTILIMGSIFPIGVRWLPYCVPILSVGFSLTTRRRRVDTYFILSLGAAYKFYTHLVAANANDGEHSIALFWDNFF